jgi:hypothetical protein
VRSTLRAFAVAVVLYAALALWYFRALLACPEACFVDHAALYGDFAQLARNDTRLNAWILAWVQRSLLSAPGALFDANAFHPARGVLAGSEHLIGLAVQLLWLRPFTASAVAVHQLALAFSAVALGVSTFALVRWLAPPAWIGLVAGAAAMAMPWRSLELMHVQMLSAHWLPLLWLLALRMLSGDARRSEAWAFAAVLALQLLSSFYVAYLATASLAVLALAVAAQRAARAQGFARLALAALPAYALLAWSSRPYLALQAAGALPAVPEAAWDRAEVGTAFAVEAWRALAPRLGADLRGADALALGYSIPATVAVSAASGLVFGLGPAADPLRRRQRVAGVALAAVALVAGVFMLGSTAHVGGVAIELPAGLAARVLPGFASLRAPLRWGILVSLAAPVLASLALARLDALARARLPRRAGRAAAALAVLALLVVDLRPTPPGTEPVWRDAARTRAAYAALAALPPGPVLEIPWPLGGPAILANESLNLLASTLHWRPILNGFTAYPPPSDAFLRRAGLGLPEAPALAALGRLAGLRWIVAHGDRLSPESRRVWDEAAEDGRLRRAWSDGTITIFEVPARADQGALAAAVAAPARDRTLGGVSRAPLALAAPAGRLALAEGLAPFRATGFPHAAPIRLSIENASAREWPGFDPSPQGLVLLRYAFADSAGRLVAGATAPLDVDVPAGATVAARPIVLPPARVGRLRLCLDLVQRVDRELRPLPVDPVELEVEVAGFVAERGGEPARLVRYAEWLGGEPEVATYSCAAAR